LVDPNLIWYPIQRRKTDTWDNFRLDFFEFLKKYMINRRGLLLPDNTDDLKIEQVVVNFEVQASWARIENLMFSETFNKVAFLDIAKSDNGWNFNRDPLFFAWSDPTSYLLTYYLQKFNLEIDPFISSTMHDFFLIKPYFKWTQILFFRIFELIIDNSYLRIKTKLVVIPSCLAKGKLYTEVEVTTFYAPMVEEVIDRLFGSYEQFDDLCFFFPKNF
jgi:hypothetical protein